MQEPNQSPVESSFELFIVVCQLLFSAVGIISFFNMLYRNPDIARQAFRDLQNMLAGIMRYIVEFPQRVAQMEEEFRLAAAVHANEDANNLLNLDGDRLEQEHEQLGAILHRLLEAPRQNDDLAQPLHAAHDPSDEVDGGLPEPQPAHANQGELLANVGLLRARHNPQHRNRLPIIEQDPLERGCDKSPPSHR